MRACACESGFQASGTISVTAKYASYAAIVSSAVRFLVGTRLPRLSSKLSGGGKNIPCMYVALLLAVSVSLFIFDNIFPSRAWFESEDALNSKFEE